MSELPDRVSGWSEVAWSRFRTLPPWGQVLGWILAWWVLIPILAWRTTWAVAPKLLVTAGGLTLAVSLVAVQTDLTTPAASPVGDALTPSSIPAQTPTPTPTRASPSPSPSPSPTETPDPRVAVPEVVSLRLAQAKSMLAQAGLSANVRRQVSDERPGTVLSQRPPAGKRVKEGRAVRLVVAKATPPPPSPEPPTGVFGNPWGYNFDCCNLIYDPPAEFCSYFNCIGNFWNGRGYVIQCRDEMFSKSGGISGSCSYHGGNLRPLYARQ